MPVNLPNPTELAVPAFIFFILVEMIVGWKKGTARYEAKDTLTSLIMGLGNTVIPGLIVSGFGFYSAVWIFDNWAIFDLGYSWPIFVLALVLDDYKYYWVHRLGHRMRWMWAAHVIHHSSQHYNLSTALRQTWTSRITPGFLLTFPLLILGFDPAILFFVGGLNLIYQFWIHTEAIDKLPKWFEAIFNTPSHHRVHHGNNPRYLDANYAGIFIIWDKLHGTFVPESKDEPVRYGLVYDLATFNPLRVALHEWVQILKDMWSARGLKNKLLYLVGPPGWSPDGSRKTSDMLRTEWEAKQKAAE